MNVEAAAQSFARHPGDEKVWRLTASELGSAWGELSHEEASRLALAVGKTETPNEPEWLRGARAMLLGVLEGILHARTAERVGDQVRKQFLGEALALRPSWAPILRTLLRRPSRPSEIAPGRKDESGVSKILGEMETKGFVERIEAKQSASSDARAVFFQLTPNGRALAKRCDLGPSEKTIEVAEKTIEPLFSFEPPRDSPSGAWERVGNVSGVSMKTNGKSVVLGKGDMKSMIGKSSTQREGMSAAMHAVTLRRK